MHVEGIRAYTPQRLAELVTEYVSTLPLVIQSKVKIVYFSCPAAPVVGSPTSKPSVEYAAFIEHPAFTPPTSA